MVQKASFSVMIKNNLQSLKKVSASLLSVVFNLREGTYFFFKMPNCGAPDCTRRSTTHPNHKFHLIPAQSRDKSLRAKWLTQIKRKEIPKYLYICSDHFEADCYEKDLEVNDFFLNG